MHSGWHSDETDCMTDDTLTNLLLTSPKSSSQDRRSSSGSIPWAEDAIKHNQLEWERIERIFYGEDPLPADPETREEFLDWMTTFPYLRVSGTKINVNHIHPHNGINEEILAIDPPAENSKRKPTNGNNNRSSHILNRLRLDDPECSVNRVDQRRQWASREVADRSAKTIPMLVKSRNELTPKANSANPLRMPSIVNALTKRPQREADGRKARQPHQVLKSTVTLPLINIQHLTLGDLLTTRSISATTNDLSHKSHTKRTHK